MRNYTLRICLVLLVCMLMCACSSNDEEATGGSDEIVGTWMHVNNEKYKDILEGYISEDIFFRVYYTFNADGTGSTSLHNQRRRNALFRSGRGNYFLQAMTKRTHTFVCVRFLIKQRAVFSQKFSFFSEYIFRYFELICQTMKA